jgi:hypothetical protein
MALAKGRDTVEIGVPVSRQNPVRHILIRGSLDATLARLAAVRPSDYARTRNHLVGAITQLSAYVTHGLLTEPEMLGGVLAQACCRCSTRSFTSWVGVPGSAIAGLSLATAS